MVTYENFNNHSSVDYGKLSQSVSTMTSFTKQKKRSNKNKKLDGDNDTKEGPKIRHPSGPVCIDIIFKKEPDGDKKKLTGYAKLYQNLIEYSLSKDYSLSQYKPEGKHGFKIAEIGHWILKHNQDYISHYRGADSHIKDSIKLDGVLKRIKRYLLNLQQWGLIEKLAEVDPDTKNGQKTPLYDYTILGYIIAWTLQCLYNPDKKNTAKDEIYKLVQEIQRRFNSYMTDFLAKIYEKFKEVGFFDTIIINLIAVLESGLYHYSNAIEYLSHALNLVLIGGKTRVKSYELYREALDEFPEDTRRIIIHHEKNIVEYNFLVAQPPKNWQKVWLDNINNSDKLVLYAVCQNKECSCQYPVVANYYDYRQAKSLSPHNYLYSSCVKCKTKDSLHVYDSLIDLRL
jgi:hypothetical protein